MALTTGLTIPKSGGQYPNMSKNVVAIVAIVAITIIVGLALYAGLDGNVIIASVSVVGGLGGYVARQVNAKPHA